MKRETIVIYVEGGVVQGVRTNAKHPPKIEVFDVDNLEETNTKAEIEEKWEKVSEKCPTILL